MHIKNTRKLKNNESGVVAIVLTVFVLIVLSLVVVAFSQNSRREQRQALDRQLSTQAFYAAESGVNQTISMIRANDPSIRGVNEYTECSQGGNKILDTNTANGGQNAFSVSCLLFDRHPPVLQWTSVDTSKGQFVSLQTEGNNLNSIKLSWIRSEGGSGRYNDCADTGSYLTLPSDASGYAATCGAGMLRVLLMPYSAGSGREKLYNDSYTVYLRPTRNGVEAASKTPYEAHSNGPNTQGRIIPAVCSGARCEATITGVPAGGSVFAQLRSIYYANSVDLTGFGVSGESVNFNQAQVKIDVTGKANDVLKRVQVRMPLYEKYSLPSGALDAMSGICKKLGVYPSIGGAPAKADNSDCGGLN